MQRQQVRRQQGTDPPPQLWPANNSVRIPVNDGTFRQPIPPEAINRQRMPNGFPSDQVFRHPANSGDQRILIQRLPDSRRRSVLVPQTQQQFPLRSQQHWIRVPTQTHTSTSLSTSQPSTQQCPDMKLYNQMLSPRVSRISPPGASQSQSANFGPQAVKPLRS